MGRIYLVRNVLNGKGYVGLTTLPLKSRWDLHVQAARRGLKETLLHQAIRKYGAESFTVESLEEAETLDELNALERRYIRSLSTRAPGGYNLSAGGGGTPGVKWSDESKRRASAAARKKFQDRPDLVESYRERGRLNADHITKMVEAARRSNTGRRHTEETRAKVSRALLGNSRRRGVRHAPEIVERLRQQSLGRAHSPEARAKISATKTGAKNPMWGRPSPRRGAVLSDEARAKISRARKARSR